MLTSTKPIEPNKPFPTFILDLSPPELPKKPKDLNKEQSDMLPTKLYLK
uniref:Uncharacterized protein n=1 Tax=viral metagenome TaxID=1070528 RepID=A0A6C0DAD1_9ZZZZ